MPQLTIVQQIAIWFLPVIFAITLHEAAHAFVAFRLGDTTAKMLGRLSFNPLRHIDLIGTIIVPLLILVLSQFNFVLGWAKPVPINANQLHHRRRDLALATAAGPGANLIMALLWAGLLKLTLVLHPQASNFALFILLTARAGILINLLLAFLNLIPIPPLDGSRVVMSLLPPEMAVLYQKIEPFGILILLLLLITGILGWFIEPLLHGALFAIRGLFNL